jgi:polysaccharide pyruvyl transferase WcaK-like protein
MSEHQATFVSPNPVPAAIKWWNRSIRLAPWIKSLWEPSYQLPASVAADVAECDVILMTGGDIISLDYGTGSLFIASGFMDAAARAGHPTMLFAASIGPFSDPVFERYMTRHLKRYSVITVRETESLVYLNKLGLDNAVLVADPAFRLKPEAIEALPLPFDQQGGLLGFNISPLIESSWRKAGNTGDLVEEITMFLRTVLRETDLSIALIPHVDPLGDGFFNSDTVILKRIEAALGEQARVVMVRKDLNAAQLKHLIGGCRYFMGGRTHATIAAWSEGVPTISFAYSTKAYGLNKDLFGTLDFVLQTPRIARDSLWRAFTELADREHFIRSLLKERIPEWKQRASWSADVLAEYLNK